MADNVIYQSGTPATPPDLTVVSTEEVTTLNGGVVTAQQVQRVAAAVRTANGEAIDLPATLADGLLVNLGANNDVSVAGTVQPLAGSVHLANTISGTVQLHGTGQQLGTYQPLAGSVHLASRLPGTVDIGTIAGTVQALGTFQPLAGSVHLASGTVSILGTTQPLAGSVHLASRLPGTADIGTIAGTVSALGTMQPLAGSVHIASALAGGTLSVAGSVWGGTFHQPPISAVTDSRIAGTVGHIVLLAPNTARQGASVFNDPVGAGGNLYLRLAPALAGTATYNVKIAPNGYYELPMRYTGSINGIWDIAGGTAQLSEW